MEILSQRDIRWKNKQINNTTSTIGNFGCTLTCLAMLSDTTPDVVASKLSFSVDRIIWTSINNTDLPIRFPDMGRAYAYDNDKVKEAINKNGGCLVEVDFDGVIKTPNDRHWILYIGNGKAYDPWTGTEISTTKYPIVKGYCIINKLIKQENDMLTEEQKRILDFLNGKTEGDVRQAFGALVDIESKDKQIQTLQSRVLDLEKSQKDLGDRLVALESNIQADLGLIEDWQNKVEIANKQNSQTLEQLEAMTSEKNKYKGYYETALKDQVNKYTGWQLVRMGINLLIKKSK